MRNYPEIGVQVSDVLLPRLGIDLKKWAVIACDQFTSQPEYWQNVREMVGSAPSTLNLILPEVYLGTAEEQELIQSTQVAMRQYLQGGLFDVHEGLILVEREVGGKKRHGLMMALDLDRYDFSQGSQSLIRATEGTIIERLPPRIRIREGAPVEVPHILVLIDDPQQTVIEPLVEARDTLRALYDTDLMQGSGHLRGWLVKEQDQENHVIQALHNLADPERFRQVYRVGEDKGVLLFAVGDGNHSLATAKSIWEKIKTTAIPNHPARYALVEVENVHDKGLEFRPIHRVLFQVQPGWEAALKAFYGGRMRMEPSSGPGDVIAAVNQQTGPEQAFGIITSTGAQVIYVQQPPSNLPVGTLQAFLDHWLRQGGASHIDYVHGDDVVCELGMQPGNLGFYLPAMDKSALFKTVILDGSLPRKTFSMGEAHEKRFYMECRQIATLR
jgi:hypothetical protein